MCILSDIWQTQDVRMVFLRFVDVVERTVTRKQILHYHQLYFDRPEPIACLPVAVDMSVCIYDDFSRLLFLYVHREVSTLVNEIPEKSGQFRFLHGGCLANIKGSVWSILAKASVMRISIPLDCHLGLFTPLTRFICSRCPIPLLSPSLVFSPLCSA
jgi:hypothetical protein